MKKRIYTTSWKGMIFNMKLWKVMVKKKTEMKFNLPEYRDSHNESQASMDASLKTYVEYL